MVISLGPSKEPWPGLTVPLPIGDGMASVVFAQATKSAEIVTLNKKANIIIDIGALLNIEIDRSHRRLCLKLYPDPQFRIIISRTKKHFLTTY